MTRIGSFCSGVGGLDLAVEELTGGTVAWHAETDAHASTVLAAHWLGVPNHGDLTTFDWTTAEQIDVLCAGFPCQPVSSAGKRKAMADERWLWNDITRAVRAMAARPGWIFLENVRGLLTAGGGLAMGHVIHDLAHLGYVGRYGLLSASAVGAPHQRERVFIAAHLADAHRPAGAQRDGGTHQPGQQASLGHHAERLGLQAPADAERGKLQRQRGPRGVAGPSGAAEGEGDQRQRRGDALGGGAEAAADACCEGREGPCDREGVGAGPDDGDAWRLDQAAADARGERREGQSTVCGTGRDAAQRGEACDHTGHGDRPFGDFQPAIDRWAAVMGRPAPWPPTIGRSLNARLVEWMMGLPEGWVTDHVPNRHALRLCGNGVVSLQALTAYRALAVTP